MTEQRDDEFGKSVAISDGTIVVGATLTTIKVLILVRRASSRRAPGDASSWTQVAKLTADDGEA